MGHRDTWVCTLALSLFYLLIDNGIPLQSLIISITPTPPQSRTDTRIHQFFWFWFSVNFNILAFSTGSAGPAFFGLDLKSSLLVLLFADLM